MRRNQRSNSDFGEERQPFRSYSFVVYKITRSWNHMGEKFRNNKYDELFGKKYENLANCDYYHTVSDNQESQSTETADTAIFINDLEGGDRSKAMKRLRVPPLDQKTKDYPRGVVFRVGLFTGMCIISLSALILTLILYKPENDSNEDSKIEEQITAIKLYRPGFFIWLFLIFIGVNIWGWRTAGVNHVLIFEIDPREHLSHQHVLEISAWLALTWIFSILCFIYKPYPNIIPPYAHPVIYYSFIGAFMLNPIKLPGMGPYYKARIWLLRRGFRLLVTPYYPVEFADFWLADQLNSLASVIMDLEYLICYFIHDGTFYGPNLPDTSARTLNDSEVFLNATSGINVTTERGASEIPTESMTYSSCGGYKTILRILLACWPAGIRFAQCLRRYYDSQKAFPHLYNAGKYSTTFFKIGFAALLHHYNNNIWFSLWMVSTVISSCYTLAWDLKMDWGFLESEADNKLLRDEIVYSNPVYYYLAITQDVLLRFAWLAEFYLTKRVTKVIESPIIKEIIVTAFKSLEVFRRFVWNFFRLENEHLNNCGEFRAVRDISINPLRQDDLDTLFRMMDVEDLLINRKKPERNDTDRSSFDKCRGIANRDFSHGTSWAEPLDIRETIFKQMAYSHGVIRNTRGRADTFTPKRMGMMARSIDDQEQAPLRKTTVMKPSNMSVIRNTKTKPISSDWIGYESVKRENLTLKNLK
jgi:hypothetical protein